MQEFVDYFHWHFSLCLKEDEHTQFRDGVWHVEIFLKVVKDDLGGVCCIFSGFQLTWLGVDPQLQKNKDGTQVLRIVFVQLRKSNQNQYFLNKLANSQELHWKKFFPQTETGVRQSRPSRCSSVWTSGRRSSVYCQAVAQGNPGEQRFHGSVLKSPSLDWRGDLLTDSSDFSIPDIHPKPAALFSSL